MISAFKRFNSTTSADEPVATDASEQETVSSAVAAATESGFGGFGMEDREMGTRPNTRPPMDLQPTNAIYVGNLLFEATPQDLEREFSAYGDIVSSRVAQDARGLSKGYVFLPLFQPYKG